VMCQAIRPSVRSPGATACASEASVSARSSLSVPSLSRAQARSKCLSFVNMRLSSIRSRRGRQAERRLADEVAPSARRAHLGVAEPELLVDRLAAGRALEPELGGDDGGVAVDAGLLAPRLLDLVLPDVLLGLRPLDEVRLGVDAAVSGHEHEVV